MNAFLTKNKLNTETWIVNKKNIRWTLIGVTNYLNNVHLIYMQLNWKNSEFSCDQINIIKFQCFDAIFMKKIFCNISIVVWQVFNINNCSCIQNNKTKFEINLITKKTFWKNILKKKSIELDRIDTEARI